MIDRFEKRPIVANPLKTRVIYLSVDPTGGGKSALSFFGMTFVDGKWIGFLQITIKISCFVYYRKMDSKYYFFIFIVG